MTTLGDFARIAGDDNNYCVVTTLRSDGTMQGSVVSAGVMREDVVFVAVGGTRKLANLRLRPQCTLVARAGGAWAAVEGTATIIGPDDPAPDVDAESLRVLLRDAFAAAGGTHDNWEEYDRVMAADRRAVVLVRPSRIYSNG